MRKVIEELKTVTFLGHQDVIKLKQYIHQKRPAATKSQKAAILADALHKIIEKPLVNFEKNQRISIRLNLLQKAINNNNYNINGDEIFKVLLHHENGTKAYLKAFAQWVNDHQKTPVPAETLAGFVKKVKSIGIELLEQDIDLLLDRTEELSEVSTEPADISALPSSVTEYNTIPTPTVVSLPLEQTEPLPFKTEYSGRIRKFLGAAAISVAILLSPFLATGFLKTVDTPNTTQIVSAATPNLKKDAVQNVLPAHLIYKSINQRALKVYLIKKNSLLSEEPYFTAITKAAQEFNLNPLLLFAIAGHEQAFVPKDHVQARKIANNPFNVYSSWQNYNTDIKDSSRIAARTLVTASKNRPPGADPIKWINKKYAEDPQWWVGVSSIYNSLEKATTNQSKD